MVRGIVGVGAGMHRSNPVRLERGVMGAAILLVHAVLVWLLIQTRAPSSESNVDTEPLLATIFDEPRWQPLSSEPIEIEAQLVTPKQSWEPTPPEIPNIEIESAVESETPTAPQAAAPPPPSVGSGEPAGRASGVPNGGWEPTVLQRVLPSYPATSIRLREEGVAIVLVRVDDRGRVRDTKLARTSGFKRLDEAAIRGVAKWKFAPAPAGTRSADAWGQFELRFNLFNLNYSRIEGEQAGLLPAEEIKMGAQDVATPGGEAALLRFIGDVSTGSVANEPAGSAQKDLARIRSALEKWGAVQSVQITNGAGNQAWGAYEIKREYRSQNPSGRVELRWDTYLVRHQNDITVWLVAFDRNREIWSVRVGPAPPGLEAGH
jgi:periplasmic protein TonB